MRVARRLTWGAAAVAAVVFAGVIQAQQGTVQPLLDDLLPAANAHDTDRFLKGYAHDSTLVFVYNGVVTTGFANVRDIQLKAWANTDVVYSQRGPITKTVLAPDIVVVTDPLSSRRTGPDGQAKTGDFTVTMVCQRRGGAWRIVYVHESSVPIRT
jgi:uncharacterized protein (TIGR02246 family)